PRDQLTGMGDIGTGPLGVIGNIIWFILAGWWLALAHLVTALIWAVTIIGLPFAWAHLKLAGIALWPIGKAIVPVSRLKHSPHGAIDRDRLVSCYLDAAARAPVRAGRATPGFLALDRHVPGLGHLQAHLSAGRPRRGCDVRG